MRHSGALRSNSQILDYLGANTLAYLALPGRRENVLKHWLQGPMLYNFLKLLLTNVCNKLECLTLQSLSSLVQPETYLGPVS